MILYICVSYIQDIAYAIAACNSESKFAKAYSKGMKKTEYWEVGSL